MHELMNKTLRSDLSNKPIHEDSECDLQPLGALAQPVRFYVFKSTP